ncbi:MAG: (2Fe-2S)-binding protein, partial [Bacillota bacterium]
LPELKRTDIINSFSGLRAKEKSDDFVISPSSELTGLINVAGIQSPGLSAAPAIAEFVVDILKEVNEEIYADIDLSYKEDFSEKLEVKNRFYKADYKSWQQVVKDNPDYGEIICRCEKVTKGEIITAINSPVPARSVDAVKRRTRAGTGRCQGGFCQPRVLEILADELDISPLKVLKKGEGSELLVARSKELLSEKVGENK